MTDDRPEPTHQSMTDETHTDTAHDRSDDESTGFDDESTGSDDESTGSDDESTGSGFDRLSAPDVRGFLDRLALAALVVLALIAGWNFYGYVGTAIRTWIDPAYQPFVLAGFNFAVLLVALAGVIHQLRRLRRDEEAAAERTEESDTTSAE